MIVDLKTLEQAEKVEESIKTGYIDAIMENLVNWLAVEEDLSESYEKLSKALATPDERETANELFVLSSSDVEVLRMRLQGLEGLDSERQKRIRLVRRLLRGSTEKAR